MISGTCRDSAGELEPLALPRASQVDAGEEHGQLRRLNLDPDPSSDLGHLERAGLKPLEVGITMPSLLWRYTNCLRPDRDRLRVARLQLYRAGRFLGMTKAGYRAAIQELFPFASCRSRRSSSLSAHTITCFPEGVRREWVQPCLTQ
jgi:hypothetical protein